MRLAGVLGVAFVAACGTDMPTATGPSYTTRQLALNFDSLAGKLSPSDSRIYWLQQIDNAMANGAGRTPIEIDVVGRSNLYWAVAAATVPVLLNPGLVGEVDSTYILAAWTGNLVPFTFLEASIEFMGRGSGRPDSAAAQVVYYPDSISSGIVGDTVVAAVQHIQLVGACTPVMLVHLYQPAGPCSLILVEFGYQSSINGMPYRAMQGVRFTPTG